MSQHNYTDKIEKYHQGEMSGEELTSFERELANSPELKAESDFQSDIIGGLKAYRKNQLKTRLNAIDLSPGWVEFVQQSVLVKSFGGVALATLIGSGIYMVADKEESNIENLATIESSEFVVPLERGNEFVWAVEPKEVVTQSRIVTPRKEESNIKEVIATITKEPVKKEEEVFTPNISVPTVAEVNEGDNPSSPSLDVIEGNNASSKVSKNPIDVETFHTKSSKILYKYYDGKLFLQGNFNNKPYELIEINNSEGRRLYLLHSRKYYEILVNDQLSTLPEVRNIKLIQELRLIQDNK